MTLHVFTARYSTRDPDRLDITRMGCDRARKANKPAPGEFLAPSWEILKPALAWRRAFEERCKEQNLDENTEYFRIYRERYREEMLTSWRRRRSEWEALLARERVVLVCFCPVAAYCHRTIAAGFLASPRLGAVHEGEIGAAT